LKTFFLTNQRKIHDGKLYKTCRCRNAACSERREETTSKKERTLKMGKQKSLARADKKASLKLRNKSYQRTSGEREND